MNKMKMMTTTKMKTITHKKTKMILTILISKVKETDKNNWSMYKILIAINLYRLMNRITNPLEND